MEFFHTFFERSFYSQFYLLSQAGLKDCLYVSLRVYENMNDYKIFRGELELGIPIQFQTNIGKKVYDVIPTGFPGLDLFSNKIIGTLVEDKISGWKTYPCEIYDRGNNRIEGYSIFSVTGRCSAIDYSKSKKIMIQPFTLQGKPVEGIRGLYFDPDSWDGKDIFTPENSKFTFVTERVKKLFEKYRITNIQFKKITEFEH
jgi:hypothetical protein